MFADRVGGTGTLEAHQPRFVGGIGRCAVCGVPGPCGPYEIAMSVFAGLGSLLGAAVREPHRRPAALVRISHLALIDGRCTVMSDDARADVRGELMDRPQRF